jgi:Tol biopolymer transport system component
MHKSVSCGLLVVVTLVAGQGSAGGREGGAASEAIVYERKGDLYAVAVDGSRTVQLTKTRTQELEPSVSPDGRSIAFTGRRVRGQDLGPWIGFVDLAGGELWTMSVDGTQRSRLTRGKDSDPAWSPDGETIFFSRVVGGPYWDPCRSIFRARNDGRELRQVTRIVRGGGPGRSRNFVMAPLDPAVSPDGRRLAFTDRFTCETSDTLPHLELVDAFGRETSDLAQLPEASLDLGYADPTWSPDGGRVAFARFTWPAGPRVYVADRDGSGVSRVVPRRKVSESPAWSPDGDWVAFVGRGDIYVIHPAGTGLRQLTRTKGIEHSPAWLPRMPTR